MCLQLFSGLTKNPNPTPLRLYFSGSSLFRTCRDATLHFRLLQVDPEGVFVLPPAAVQELQLKVQPWRAGSRFLYVNAVDVENRRLVTAWLLCLNVHRPVLSKVAVVLCLCLFEMAMRVFVLWLPSLSIWCHYLSILSPATGTRRLLDGSISQTF